MTSTSVKAVAAAITSVTLEVPDPAAAGDFYRAAFGLGAQVRFRASEEPTDQPYGVRDCAVRDPAGNLVRIQEVH